MVIFTLSQSDKIIIYLRSFEIFKTYDSSKVLNITHSILNLCVVYENSIYHANRVYFAVCCDNSWCLLSWKIEKYFNPNVWRIRIRLKKDHRRFSTKYCVKCLTRDCLILIPNQYKVYKIGHIRSTYNYFNKTLCSDTDTYTRYDQFVQPCSTQ